MGWRLHKRSRIAVCTLGVMGAFAFVALRLVQLHILDAERLAQEAEQTRKRVVTLDAKRGDILDRHGNLLAGTRKRIKLGIDPTFFEEADLEKLAVVAAVIGEDWPTVRAKALQRTRVNAAGETREIRWAPLAVIDEDEYAHIRALGLRAVYGNAYYERYYPGGKLAAHLLGYLNREEVAVMGVEAAFDYYLRGQDGWLETEVDGRRREVPSLRARQVDPRDGTDIQLTLDLYIQSVVESALAELVAQYRPDGASVIVSAAGSGEILALGNWPVFDPNQFWKAPVENQRNRAVTDLLEPGSTFKIVTVGAALQERIVDPLTVVDCSLGSAQHRGVVVDLPDDSHRYGELPVWRLMQKSSNSGSAQIGLMLGEQRMYAYTRAFGFGQRTGWRLGGEVPGILAEPKDWDGLTLTRLPTGYAIAATPLQVHLAMATVANGGLWCPARLVAANLDADGQPLHTFKPERAERRVLAAETAWELAEMLEQVATREGTARRAEIAGYRVAGKTGTSRKIVDGRYREDAHNASFSGFFPVNEPAVVITVVVDNAQKDGVAYGGSVAAPVFKQVAERLIPYLNIRKPEQVRTLVAEVGGGE